MTLRKQGETLIHRGDDSHASTQKTKAIRERQERNTSTKQSPVSKLTIFQARNSVARARETRDTKEPSKGHSASRSESRGRGDDGHQRFQKYT